MKPTETAPGAAPVEVTAEAKAAFQALAREQAAEPPRKVVAWGQAQLDTDADAELFAVLRGGEDVETMVYLVDDGGARWLLEAMDDGRTIPWHGGYEGEAEPPWEVTADKRIEHRQTHRGGFEAQWVALRGGAWVIMKHEYMEDAREDDSVETKVEAVEDARGECGTTCPALTGELDYGTLAAKRLED